MYCSTAMIISKLSMKLNNVIKKMPKKGTKKRENWEKWKRK